MRLETIGTSVDVLTGGGNGISETLIHFGGSFGKMAGGVESGGVLK